MFCIEIGEKMSLTSFVFPQYTMDFAIYCICFTGAIFCLLQILDIDKTRFFALNFYTCQGVSSHPCLATPNTVIHVATLKITHLPSKSDTCAINVVASIFFVNCDSLFFCEMPEVFL